MCSRSASRSSRRARSSATGSWGHGKYLVGRDVLFDGSVVAPVRRTRPDSDAQLFGCQRHPIAPSIVTGCKVRMLRRLLPNGGTRLPTFGKLEERKRGK